MKKLIALFSIISLFLSSQTVQAQATVKWPFGSAAVLTVANTSTVSVTVTATIKNNISYIETLPTLAGNVTLDLTLSSELKAGAMLFVKIKTAASETFTFGTGIDGPVVTGSAGKTWTQGFWYDGTIFLPMGAKIQID